MFTNQIVTLKILLIAISASHLMWATDYIKNRRNIRDIKIFYSKILWIISIITTFISLVSNEPLMFEIGFLSLVIGLFIFGSLF